MMEEVNTFETSIDLYKTTLCIITEGCHLKILQTVWIWADGQDYPIERSSIAKRMHRNLKMSMVT